MPKLSSRAPSSNALSAKPQLSRARSGLGFRRFEFLLWLAPALLLVGALTYLPILTEVVLSFFAADGFSMPRFIGFANYTQAIGQPDFWAALLNNVWYAIGTVSGKLILALIAALLLNGPFRGRAAFRALFFLPVILSFVAIGLLWTLIFNYNYGLINFLLQAIGLADFKRDWLGAPETAFPAVIFVDLWKWTGFHVVIYLAGLQSIPGELYEAAALDGASRWQILWRITLPLLKPFTAVNVVIASLGAFSVFDLIYVMTQGGPFKSTNVAMVEVYLQAFQFNQFGYAAALSVLVLLLIIGLSFGLLRLFRSGPAEREA
jgi:ABC-type sugar transport system permease subunit